ncbi:hypothetical protein [Paenibacillus roseipurpureus]|uniref:Uncharacterized protein n=1 Tax=Paenibacillus roseopurpureus TaxID=2918901 RepID=A0AA96LPV6_9BACL|nr:hypothetical protein [Paenibacillus sp. MBLB1832]WNR45117.1 hypothetical protein MJB10_02910 [Paenibacillus sp. MBLB1832]
MIPGHAKSFIYLSEVLYVWLTQKSKSIYVMASVNGITERVYPVPRGFLTTPKSKIAALFERKDVMLIPWDGANEYVHICNKVKHRRVTEGHKAWIQRRGAAQGGILYGELVPRGPVGWYVVLMMEIGDSGVYFDYIEPEHIFLGENQKCEDLRKERGVTAVFRRDCEFLVTEVTGLEVANIIKKF